ncbi:hypothetical protein [Natronococcus pandeyae]|uniref:hypothetical protein n=1 Tax=Natronococcus pandeyae TaxID=2055836 RepID=UPI001653227A|nr:hypothetical protein [Natronococcus pandeyae]
MDLRRLWNDLTTLLEGDEMTGRQAAIIVGVWLVLTAVFGIIVFLVVFVMMGF